MRSERLQFIRVGAHFANGFEDQIHILLVTQKVRMGDAESYISIQVFCLGAVHLCEIHWPAIERALDRAAGSAKVH